MANVMRAAVGILAFCAVAVALAVLAGLAFQGLSPVLAGAVFFLAALIGVGAALQCEPDADPDVPVLRSWPAMILFAVFALAAARAFLWLIYDSGNDIMVLSPYNMGDLSLHITLIRYLASGVPFWPESPILADSQLVYPVGMDLFNSLLLLAGVPLEQGLIWCGLGGSVLTAWALWRWAGAFGLAAFLFTGGITGFAWFVSGSWAFEDYGRTSEWKNAFLTMFVTQRNFLYALPAGLLLLIDWRNQLRSRPALLPFWLTLLIYASMPLFSVHAFLFLSACLVGAFFGMRSASGRPRFLALGFAAVVPATFAVALVTGGFSISGGIRLHFGWMQEDAPWTFWIQNFGIMAPLWGFALWQMVRLRDWSGLALVVPATLVFLSCFVFAYAPWPWDNTKLMIWGWLLVVPWIWNYVLDPLPVVARAVLCVALFFTGAMSLVAGLDGRHGYMIASRSELDRTAALVADIPISARFAVAPDYAHPLLLLGRKVTIGFDGHLWSHGLDYIEKSNANSRLLLGEPTWPEDATTLGANYIFWGEREIKRFPLSPLPWHDGNNWYSMGDQVIPIPIAQ